MTQAQKQARAKANKRESDREYYDKNKETIAKQKKNRYANDPAYRQRMYEARKRQAAREKEARRIRREKIQSGEIVPKTPGKRMRITLGDTGETAVTTLYKVGYLATKMKLKTQTLRTWEANGILPPAMYRSSGGHRLYTADQLEVVVTTYRRFRSDRTERGQSWRITDGFIRAMHRAWNGLHYGIKVDPEDMENGDE